MANQLTSLGLTSIYNNDFRSREIGMKSKELEAKAEAARNGKRKFEDLLIKAGESTGKVDKNKLTKEETKLYNSCVEMESLLWKQMLNAMKKTINKTKLIDGGQTEEIFTDFLYDEYATNRAKNTNSKISETLFKQLSGYYNT
jgi:flagellar protein FlgJ